MPNMTVSNRKTVTLRLLDDKTAHQTVTKMVEANIPFKPKVENMITIKVTWLYHPYSSTTDYISIRAKRNGMMDIKGFPKRTLKSYKMPAITKNGFWSYYNRHLRHKNHLWRDLLSQKSRCSDRTQ